MDLAQLAGWSYPAVAALVAADALVPLVPSEFAILSAGVLAATGRMNLALLVLAAAVGAAVGDTVGYLLGRGAGRFGVGRLLRRERSRRVVVWTTERLHRRARWVLIAARFVPGGRTVTVLTAGFLRVPPRRFAGAVAVGAPLWAGYVAALGYGAGHASADHPWIGVLAALAVLTGLGCLAEWVRRRRARRAPADTARPTDPAVGRRSDARTAA
jgi:membrane-associated protein